MSDINPMPGEQITPAQMAQIVDIQTASEFFPVKDDVPVYEVRAQGPSLNEQDIIRDQVIRTAITTQAQAPQAFKLKPVHWVGIAALAYLVATGRK